jgi:hypothetical protein
VSHSSIILRNTLRNSSSVTLRYTSRFICVVHNLFRKRSHTFWTVHTLCLSLHGGGDWPVVRAHI